MEDQLTFSRFYDGSKILDLANIKMKQYEAPEDLYQRLLECVEQSLLVSNSCLSHHGEVINENEKVSPSLENILVLMWLNLIHKELPHLVKRKFETLLQTNTLASIRPTISQSLHMLLGEILTSYSTIETTAKDTRKNVQQPIKTPPLRCHLCKQTGKSSHRHDSAVYCQSSHGKPTKVKKSSRKERDKEKHDYKEDKELKVYQKRVNKKTSSSNKKSKSSYREERCKTNTGSKLSNIGNVSDVSGRESTVKNNNSNNCDDSFGKPLDSQSVVASTIDENSNNNLDERRSELTTINTDLGNNINTSFGNSINIKRTSSNCSLSADSTDIYLFNDDSDEINDRKTEIYNSYDLDYDAWANCDIYDYNKDILNESFYVDSNLNNKSNIETNDEFTVRENYDLNSNDIDKLSSASNFGINDIDNTVKNHNRFNGNDTTLYFDSCNNDTIHLDYETNTNIENDILNDISCFKHQDSFTEMDMRALKDDPQGTVAVKQSPFFHAYYQNQPLKITIDSGAETNMIKERLARQIGISITKTSQQATQADGQSPLTIIGETRMNLTRNSKCFFLEALVVENIDVDILAGVPFMTCNDVSVRPAKQQIIIGDGTIYEYGAITLNIESPTPRFTSYDLENMALENESRKELGEFSQEIDES